MLKLLKRAPYGNFELLEYHSGKTLVDAINNIGERLNYIDIGRSYMLLYQSGFDLDCPNLIYDNQCYYNTIYIVKAFKNSLAEISLDDLPEILERVEIINDNEYM